ncbi:hypothetical protein [Streptomyces sp. NPDC002324]
MTRYGGGIGRPEHGRLRGPGGRRPGEDTAADTHGGTVVIVWGGASGLSGTACTLANHGCDENDRYGQALAAGDLDADAAVGGTGKFSLWIGEAPYTRTGEFTGGSTSLASRARPFDQSYGVEYLSAGDILNAGWDNLVIHSREKGTVDALTAVADTRTGNYSDWLETDCESISPRSAPRGGRRLHRPCPHRASWMRSTVPQACHHVKYQYADGHRAKSFGCCRRANLVRTTQETPNDRSRRASWRGCTRPAQRDQLHVLLQELSATTAVVMATHLMEDVEGCCNSVVVLKDGRKRFAGPLEELRSAGGYTRVIADGPEGRP